MFDFNLYKKLTVIFAFLNLTVLHYFLSLKYLVNKLVVKIYSYKVTILVVGKRSYQEANVVSCITTIFGSAAEFR